MANNTPSPEPVTYAQIEDDYDGTIRVLDFGEGEIHVRVTDEMAAAVNLDVQRARRLRDAIDAWLARRGVRDA